MAAPGKPPSHPATRGAIAIILKRISLIYAAKIRIPAHRVRTAQVSGGKLSAVFK